MAQDFELVDFDDLNLNVVCMARAAKRIVFVQATTPEDAQWYLGWVEYNIPKELIPYIMVLYYPHPRDELLKHLETCANVSRLIGG